MHFLPRAILVLGVLASVAWAEDPALEAVDGEASSSELAYQTGVVELPGGIARVELPDGFHYLSPAEAQDVLRSMGGPPPGTAELLLGMVASAESPGAWGSVLSYSKDGYVSEQDMVGLNKPLYLEYLKRQNVAQNEKRKAQRLPALELTDMGGLPFYDRADRTFSHQKRYWNDRARSGEEMVMEREEWVLGRRGKIVVGTIEMSGGRHFSSKWNSPKITKMIHFNRGHRYEDFNPKSDARAMWPAEIQLKEAAAEGKGLIATMLRSKLPLLLLVLFAFGVKKVVDRIREA